MYKRWRVYSTFFTGLCIGLLYALLLGHSWSMDSADTVGVIDSKVLLLTFSGILGGVIYTILIDGEIEMPRFIVNEGALFKAGLFGDILLGIAGALILEVLLPSSLFVVGETELNSSAIAATGIIGGYGGRAIIKFSLERFFKHTGSLDEVRRAALVRRPNAATPETATVSTTASIPVLTDDEPTLSLIEQVDGYIKEGLPSKDWAQLTRRIEGESPVVRQGVFSAIVDLRQAMAQQLNNEQLQRMIVLLDGLAHLSPTEHAIAHQLALLHMDLSPPAYSNALAALDKAIALRGPLTIGQLWQYELHRAVLNIEQGQSATTDFTLAADTQRKILADLLTIARVYNLDTILRAADKQQIPLPVVNWIRHNQAFLTAQEEARSLLPALRSVLIDRPLHPIATVPQPPTEPSSVSNSPNPSPLGQPLSLQENAVLEVVFPEIFSALGRCYDILYLDPFNILGSDSAKKTQVFDFHAAEAIPKRDEGETVWIPKGTRYTPGSSGELDISKQADLLYSESQIQKMFAGTLGATLTRFLGAVLPFSLSTSYARYKSERTTQKSVYAFTKAEYVHYTLELDPQQSGAFRLNKTFRQAVAQLPLTSAYEYLNFISDFGTHTAIRVMYGGLFHHRYCLKQSAYESIVEAGGNVALEAKRAVAAKYENKRQESQHKAFSASSESFDFCGGMKKENIHDWFATIKADPAPIHLELTPLYDLFNSSFFPRDEQIIKKRSLLTAAVQTYLEKNSQQPAWELWPSVAVGGNGGERFSDIDLAPIWREANEERYQKARVTEVCVWIKNWIERVQIVLEGDMPPLPGHGDEDGNLKILKLDPDDYITAVHVMPGSPQKILVNRGTYIGSIRVQTYKKQDWIVGTPDDRAIALDIPEDYQAIGFHGRCGKHIDKLGVISIPVIK